MRTNSAIALLVSSVVLLLAAWLSGSGGLVQPGWAASLAWVDLDGPQGGPANALALNPAYPDDGTVLAGGGVDLGYASWAGLGLFRSMDGGLAWSAQGPHTGAVFDVAFSPAWSDDGFALAGLWTGVWATDDGGSTWRQLSSLETGGPGLVAAVAVTTAGDARTLLAGGWYGALWRSEDDGATWSAFDGAIGVRRMRIHPRRPEVALAASGNGLWRSADGGLAWTPVLTTSQVFDVAFAADGSAAYATSGGRLWRSADAGLTWAAVPGLDAPFLDQIGLSDDGAALFVAAQDDLYRVDPATLAVAAVPTNLRTGYYLRLAPSPHFAGDQTLFAGTFDGVWISHDGGVTFVRSDGFSAFPLRAVAAASDELAAGELFAGGEYGVWRRIQGVWRPANVGLGGSMASTVTDLAVSPAYAGDGTLFVARSISVSRGGALYRSTDRGDSWQWLVSAGYIGQVELSPAFGTDQRVFMVADQHLAISDDRGATWSVQPFWTGSTTARLLALAPGYSTDRTVYVVGSAIYISHDGGLTWETAVSPPPEDANGGWQPSRLTVAQDGRLYLARYRYDLHAPYARHDQLWTSADQGTTWVQLEGAPDLPVASLATGPGTGGATLYMSVYDDSEYDDRMVAPDLYVSRDQGATWQNLGAVPDGAAFVLATAPGAVDQLVAGSRGAWLLDEAGPAPTATPDPCQELLQNRSFEREGVWRIPVTAYSAARTTERHSHGYWSMRVGIAAAAENVRSYSDFSQDVTLPAGRSATLRVQRWSSGGGATAVGVTPAALREADTLDAFQALLAGAAGDLNYVLVITADGAIHPLYVRLDDERVWVDETLDLSQYAGARIRLQFGTYNDGAGAVSVQYFDALSLLACVATPAPTATPPHLLWLPDVMREEPGTIPPP